MCGSVWPAFLYFDIVQSLTIINMIINILIYIVQYFRIGLNKENGLEPTKNDRIQDKNNNIKHKQHTVGWCW